MANQRDKSGYRRTKQQSGSHVCTICETLADSALLPHPDGPKMTSGSDEGDVMYLELERAWVKRDVWRDD